MAFLIGCLFGGWLLGSIIINLTDRFAPSSFRENPPTMRASVAAIFAFLVVSLIAGFGFADGGPFVWTAGLLYVPGIALAWFLYRRKLARAYQEENEGYQGV